MGVLVELPNAWSDFDSFTSQQKTFISPFAESLSIQKSVRPQHESCQTSWLIALMTFHLLNGASQLKSQDIIIV